MTTILTPSAKNDQNGWSIVFSLIFGLLTAAAIYTLHVTETTPHTITVFEATIIMLAVFRLTRLFVYDKIARFIRDWFIIKEECMMPSGETVVCRRNYDRGFRRNVADLLACPWCVGVWLSLVVSFFYFWNPYAWFPIFVLAIAGLSTLVQILINLIGWRAEQAKMLVEEESDSVLHEYHEHTERN